MQTFDDFWEERDTLVQQLAGHITEGENHWHGLEEWLPNPFAEDL